MIVTNEVYLLSSREVELFYVKKQYLVYSNPDKEIKSIYQGPEYKIYTGYWDFTFEDGIKLIWLVYTTSKEEHSQKWSLSSHEEQRAVKNVLSLITNKEWVDLPAKLKEVFKT